MVAACKVCMVSAWISLVSKHLLCGNGFDLPALPFTHIIVQEQGLQEEWRQAMCLWLANTR